MSILFLFGPCVSPTSLNHSTFEGHYFEGTYFVDDSSSDGSDAEHFLALLDAARRMLSSGDTEFQTPSGVIDASENAYAEGAQWAGMVWTQNTVPIVHYPLCTRKHTKSLYYSYSFTFQMSFNTVRLRVGSCAISW